MDTRYIEYYENGSKKKEVHDGTITEYNEKKRILCKNSDGVEDWKEYGGNIRSYTNLRGEKISYEYKYDERGNMIYMKDSKGGEWWGEHDENGNIIHCKDDEGNEERFEYDERGNNIYCKDSDGDVHYREYDENDECVYHKMNNEVLIDNRENKGE